MVDDIRHLVVFAKVAATLSISRAAEALDLSPATVSAQLAKLESSLGVPLLYRNTRRLSLTSEGQRLLETASAILSLYESGMLELRQQQVALGGRLRVAAPAVLVNCTPFMSAVASFLSEHEGLQAEIGFSDLRADVVGEGVDVAFRIGELPDSALKARPVFELRRTIVAASDWLDRQPPLVHPDQLASMPWIGLTMRPHARELVGPDGERVTVRYVPRVVTDHVEAAMRLAEHGLGLSVPPEALVPPAGVLRRVLPEWQLEPLAVHAVWPSNASSSGAAYRLIQRLSRTLGPVPTVGQGRSA